MASYYLVLFVTDVFVEDFKLTADLCGNKHDFVGWNFCVVDNLLSQKLGTYMKVLLKDHCVL